VKELEIQYNDFSVWQQKKSVKSMLKHQETYWLKEFQGIIPVINLPIDFNRPLTRNPEGGFQSFKISKHTASALKTLALKENTTMFVVMLAVYNVFLSKICRQQDIIVGVPTAGRRHPGLDQIIGMFVNTLALRNFPENEITFIEFLRHTRQRTLEAFDNEDYQFEDLVNQTIKQRDTSRNPIFDVFYSFRAPGVSQELPINLSDDQETTVVSGEEYRNHGTTVSMFDLYFLGAEIKGELFLVLTYSAKLFKKETIERFIGYIEEIIAAVVENRNIILGSIEISHNLGFAETTILHDEENDFGF
jgi:non-ribosomal peptide synthetase component F